MAKCIRGTLPYPPPPPIIPPLPYPPSIIPPPIMPRPHSRPHRWPRIEATELVPQDWIRLLLRQDACSHCADEHEKDCCGENDPAPRNPLVGRLSISEHGCAVNRHGCREAANKQARFFSVTNFGKFDCVLPIKGSPEEAERRDFAPDSPRGNASCRMVDASQVAFVAIFLASEKAWAVSGEPVAVSGGAGRSVYY